MKNLKHIKLLLAGFVIGLTQSVYAQFPDDMPYQSIPTPNNVNMPNYGDTVVDNSVPNPIQITRVTEAFNYVDGNGDPQVWYPTHEYAKTQVWNADQTRYKILSWKVYNATTYQEEQTLSSMYPSYWSNSDPDVIWSFRENGDVKKYTVSTNTTQTVATIPGYDFVQLGPGEGNIDKNDHYVALVGKKTNGDLDVIVFDLQLLQITFTQTFPGAWGNGGLSFPDYIDWVSISQSGNYVVIMWNHNTTSASNPFNGHYGVEVYDALTMQYQNRIITYGNHGDLGYAVDGDEVLVQFYGIFGGGSLYMHKLNGSGSTVIATHSDFGVAGHVSCRNINRPGWAYITHSLPAQSGQMVAVKLDNSGLVEHFGHHFSSATSYAQASMAVSSPNGDKICFKSDFLTGPNTTPSVAYSFFAELSTFPSYDTTVNVSICDGDSYVVGDSTYTVTGNYTNNLLTTVGMDSIVHTNLTVNPVVNTSQNIQICFGETYSIGNSTYSMNGVYKDTLQSVTMCDSIVETTLTVNGAIDITNTINGNDITANQNNATYQWLDCDNNNQPINNATQQTLTVDHVGNFACIVTVGNCSDTINCQFVNYVGLNESKIETLVTIYPNPNIGVFTVDLGANNQNYSVKIIDITGQIIYTQNQVSKSKLLIDLNAVSNGLYFIEVKTSTHKTTKKILIQH